MYLDRMGYAATPDDRLPFLRTFLLSPNPTPSERSVHVKLSIRLRSGLSYCQFRKFEEA